MWYLNSIMSWILIGVIFTLAHTSRHRTSLDKLIGNKALTVDASPIQPNGRFCFFLLSSFLCFLCLYKFHSIILCFRSIVCYFYECKKKQIWQKCWIIIVLIILWSNYNHLESFTILNATIYAISVIKQQHITMKQFPIAIK